MWSFPLWTDESVILFLDLDCEHCSPNQKVLWSFRWLWMRCRCAGWMEQTDASLLFQRKIVVIRVYYWSIKTNRTLFGSYIEFRTGRICTSDSIASCWGPREVLNRSAENYDYWWHDIAHQLAGTESISTPFPSLSGSFSWHESWQVSSFGEASGCVW